MTGRRREPTPAEREQHELAALMESLLPTWWPGPGPAPHLVAHLDPRRDVVTFVMRGWPEQLAWLVNALAAGDPLIEMAARVLHNDRARRACGDEYEPYDTLDEVGKASWRLSAAAALAGPTKTREGTTT